MEPVKVARPRLAGSISRFTSAIPFQGSRRRKRKGRDGRSRARSIILALSQFISFHSRPIQSGARGTRSRRDLRPNRDTHSPRGDGPEFTEIIRLSGRGRRASGENAGDRAEIRGSRAYPRISVGPLDSAKRTRDRRINPAGSARAREREREKGGRIRVSQHVVRIGYILSNRALIEVEPHRMPMGVYTLVECSSDLMRRATISRAFVLGIGSGAIRPFLASGRRDPGIHLEVDLIRTGTTRSVSSTLLLLSPESRGAVIVLRCNCTRRPIFRPRSLMAFPVAIPREDPSRREIREKRRARAHAFAAREGFQGDSSLPLS